MNEQVRIFSRGFVLIFLIALNTRMLAGGHIWGALSVGFCLSWVWWGNSRSATTCDAPWARECYAAGAALAGAAALLITR